MRAIDRLMEAMIKSSVGTQTVAELDTDCLRERSALRSQLSAVEAEIKALHKDPRGKALAEAQEKAERLEQEAEAAKIERDRLAWALDSERDRLRNERYRLQNELSTRVPVSVELLAEEIGQRLATLTRDASGRARAEALHQLRAKALSLADLDAAELAVAVTALRREVQNA